MSVLKQSVDKPFLINVILLVIAGFFIFSSASLGLLARTEELFKDSTRNQIWLGLIGGGIALIVASYIDYKVWRKFSLPLFILSIIGLIIIFVPGIGFEYNGATRWIHIGPVSFQPSEIYKIFVVIFWASWLVHIKQKVATFKFGLLPFLVLTLISGALILSQPDTTTFGITVFATLGMYIVAGAKWRHVGTIIGIGIVGFLVLAMMKPYVMQRIHTMLDPTSDPYGSGYQIQQSMIAIGSGGVLGKGFGQSAQKFNFLPESNSDSIFAVAGEEFGLIGATLIILLYVSLALRGLKIVTSVQDVFGRLTIVGIVILIVSGSFVNIASMLGLMPITGVPLVFMSKGGTALFIALFSVGIILSISKHQTQK